MMGCILGWLVQKTNTFSEVACSTAFQSVLLKLPDKPDVVTFACHLSIPETKAERRGIADQLGLSKYKQKPSKIK